MSGILPQPFQPGARFAGGVACRVHTSRLHQSHGQDRQGLWHLVKLTPHEPALERAERDIVPVLDPLLGSSGRSSISACWYQAMCAPSMTSSMTGQNVAETIDII